MNKRFYLFFGNQVSKTSSQGVEEGKALPILHGDYGDANDDDDDVDHHSDDVDDADDNKDKSYYIVGVLSTLTICGHYGPKWYSSSGV